MQKGGPQCVTKTVRAVAAIELFVGAAGRLDASPNRLPVFLGPENLSAPHRVESLSHTAWLGLARSSLPTNYP